MNPTIGSQERPRPSGDGACGTQGKPLAEERGRRGLRQGLRGFGEVPTLGIGGLLGLVGFDWLGVRFQSLFEITVASGVLVGGLIPKPGFADKNSLGPALVISSHGIHR